MTMDRTLKTHGGLTRTRSVLTRTERIAQLVEAGKFDPEKDSPLALPKIKLRHSKAGTKTKKVEEKPAEAAAASPEGEEGKPAAAEPRRQKPA